MTKPKECGAERPGPYPVLCREAAGHEGDHYGHYNGVAYSWEPHRLHDNLRAYLAAGGDLANLRDVMAMREAEASAAIDRDSDVQTIHFETEEGQTP